MTVENSSQQRLLAKWALALTSVFLVLLLAELGARVLTARQSPRRDPAAIKKTLLANEPELTVFRSSRELDAPNLRGIFKGHLHRSNALGFRGPDYSARPRDDQFRIVIAGDSVVAGSGVAEDSAYAVQLEDLLNEAAGSDRFEVINAGLAGIHAHRVVTRLENSLRRYQPDMLVYGYTINDIEGVGYRRMKRAEGEAGFMSQLRRFNRSNSHLMRLIWPRLMSSLDLMSGKSYAREIEDNYFDNPPAWQEVELRIQQFGELVKRSEPCGMAMVHTHLSQLNFMHPFVETYDLVGATFEKNGVPVVQSFTHHRGLYGLDYWVSPIDPHPNHAGHTLLARAAYEGILTLPARCFQVRGRNFRVGRARPAVNP